MRSLKIWGLVGAVVALSGCNGLMNRNENLVATPSPCQATQFEVYFAEGQAQLTDAARQSISLYATQLQACQIAGVRVLGLASATGGSNANQALSARRATAVAEALVAAGWPTPAFEVEAAGDAGAVTETGAREPMRRRTEVLVDARPRS